MRQPHTTAIARRTISAPARLIRDRGLLDPPVLDYGCGRGKDCEELGCDGYDPHWAPCDLSNLGGCYKTILCTYVLNVVDTATQESILDDLRRLLAPGGTAYIAVRRDLKQWDGVQRLVRLDLPMLVEKSGFCTYILTNQGG